MLKRLGVAAAAALAISALAGGTAQAAAPGGQVSVLSRVGASHSPAATAATNSGDVAAIAGVDIVELNPTGKQKLLTSVPGGAFGIPIGLAYDLSHRLYVASPQSFGPPAQGTILKLSANGKSATPVPGSQNMVAPDGFGLDEATGDLYVTDIFGSSVWRIHNGVAQPWTSTATNPLVVLPDGVKVLNHAAYVSVGKPGRSSGSRSWPTGAPAPRRSGRRSAHPASSSTTWSSTTAPATSTSRGSTPTSSCASRRPARSLRSRPMPTACSGRRT